MKTVYKYEMSMPHIVTTRLPVDAKFIHFGADELNQLSMWFEIDTEQNAFIDREFHIVGTEHPIDFKGYHLGSLIAGPYVWHLYEVMDRHL